LHQWKEHKWYEQIYKRSSHALILPQCNGVFSPKSRNYTGKIGSAPWQTIAFFADFRDKVKRNTTFLQLPTLKDCSAKIKEIKTLKRLNTKSNIKIELCSILPPFNADFLDMKSKNVVPEVIRNIILKSLREGFESGYRGSNYFQRDFSTKLKPEHVLLAKEKMRNEVKKGYYIGPFKECPFPSKWSNAQAYISQVFFRPKHKYKDDGQFRLIGNKSFPNGRSFNDLVDRQDTAALIPDYKYYTFQTFLKDLRILGRNTLISQFDVKDAYKHCRMKPELLWQQFYKIDDEYFVDLGGTFGSRNAGDSWNLLMELIILSIREDCKVPYLNYFVDNGVNLTPATKGKRNTNQANQEFEQIIKFLTIAKVPFHQLDPPCTKAKFLGWIVDTDEMTVSCPMERLNWLNQIISDPLQKISNKIIQSITGVLEFLASVLPFLRAPLGWLHRRHSQREKGLESINERFKVRFRAYLKFIYDTLREWKGTASILSSFNIEQADIVIYTDASGEIGYGAIELKTKRFGQGKWSKEELKLAQRRNSTSSTYLEIRAICKAIASFAQPNACIHIHSDSMAAVFILKRRYDKNSDSSQSLIVAMDIHCRNLGISLYFVHVEMMKTYS